MASSHSHGATDHAGFWQVSGQGHPKAMLDDHLSNITAAVQDGPLTHQVPGDGYWETTFNTGALLADTVEGARDTLVKAVTFGIRHRHKVVPCRVEGEYPLLLYHLLDLLKRYVLEEGDDLLVESLEVSWHQLGPVEFAVFPGEGTPEYALALKERMVSPGRFVVGLGNDSIGYILDPESIAKDTTGQLASYELKMGLGAPGGPCAWEAMESLGWFHGNWKE